MLEVKEVVHEVWTTTQIKYDAGEPIEGENTEKVTVEAVKAVK